MDTKQLIFTLLLLVVFPCTVWGIISQFSKNKDEMTARATILSHRLELAKTGTRWSDNWNRLVTFRLSDGSEIELYTTKEEYDSLTDGQSGQLTWEKENFYHFDPDL